MQEATDHCWQCGASADPDCLYEEVLTARSSRKADGLGYHVKRGRLGDSVRVTIPRCPACRNRNYLAAFLYGTCFFSGAVVGQVIHPRWGMGIGILIGMVVGLLCVFGIQKLLRLRSVGDYPPLKRLLQAGWDYPN